MNVADLIGLVPACLLPFRSLQRVHIYGLSPQCLPSAQFLKAMAVYSDMLEVSSDL